MTNSEKSKALREAAMSGLFGTTAQSTLLALAERDEQAAQSQGVGLISAERERQITEEGYTAEHDRDHIEEMVRAAGCYTAEASGLIQGSPRSRPGVRPIADDDLGWSNWPWAGRYWKPTGDPIRDLTKAGALIAAAIDSLTDARGA